jgi:YD repeat-containing protein
MLIVPGFFMAAGCKKNEDTHAPITLLAQSVAGAETTSYSYDENNRAVGYSVTNTIPAQSYTATYSYNSSGQLAEVRYNPANSIEDTKEVYTYTASGQVATIESYYVTSTYSSLFARSEADYSIPGKVSVFRFTSAGSGTAYLHTEYFLDNKGNIIRQIVYTVTGNPVVTTENAEFDQRPNPITSLPRTGYAQNVNNYGKVTVTAAGGSPSVTTYAYEYDADGFPTQRTTNAGTVVLYAYLKK